MVRWSFWKWDIGYVIRRCEHSLSTCVCNTGGEGTSDKLSAFHREHYDDVIFKFQRKAFIPCNLLTFMYMIVLYANLLTLLNLGIVHGSSLCSVVE